MSDTNELVERLREIETNWRNLAPVEIKSRVAEAIAALAPVEAVPVAWRWRYKNTDWVYVDVRPTWFEDEAHNERFEVETLYAHPPAQAGAVTGAQGWRLVPDQPTEAMILAYNEVFEEHDLKAWVNARLVWPAMLAAAPPFP